MPFDAANEISNPVIERLCLGRARVSRGWIRNRLAEPFGPSFCVRGAVLIPEGVAIGVGTTYTQFNYEDPTYVAAEEFLRMAIGDDCLYKYPHSGSVHTIVGWNNDDVRTPQDVIAAFDRAIELAVADEVAKRAELVAV